MKSTKNPKKRSGLFAEYVYFLKKYKMWWLLPLFLLISALGLVVVLGGSNFALSIYALF